jgi:hypothetical protein
VVNATVTLFDGSDNAAPFARSSIGVAAYLTVRPAAQGILACVVSMLCVCVRGTSAGCGRGMKHSISFMHCYLF